MITLLRVASFLVNCLCVGGAALLLGAGGAGAGVACAVFFALVWWACGRAPAAADAGPDAVRTAGELAQRMGVAAPRAVWTLRGRTAAATRVGTGYALLLGDDVAPQHVEALLAHEIAHYKTGDLFWEPFTDGPARILVAMARVCAPFWVAVFPFLLFGAPLARITELRADKVAAGAVPSYLSVLREFTQADGARSSLLYPSIGERLRHSARDSITTYSNA